MYLAGQVVQDLLALAVLGRELLVLLLNRRAQRLQLGLQALLRLQQWRGGIRLCFIRKPSELLTLEGSHVLF